MHLRVFVLGLLLVASRIGPTMAGESVPHDRGKLSDDQSTRWFDLKVLEVEGQAWRETKAPFDRLPAKAEKKVRDAVWGLSRQSAGLCARFETSASSIKAKWTLTSANLAMPHMPATGVSGLDLYVKSEDGLWHWLANGRPTAQTNEVTLAANLPPLKKPTDTREFLLYLPLYNGVSSVEIGLPLSAQLSKAEPYKNEDGSLRKPIVFYGTSITQGGCASRPGMVHSAILQRRLDHPVVNLGFSGNGKMEMDVVELMAEIDASCFVIDCLPNLEPKEVAERTEPLVRKLREARPKTPILLVEDRSYSDAFLVTSKRERNEHSRHALHSAHARLAGDGVEGLFYLDGDFLLGADNEGTVDSSHPTDLGFFRQADAFEQVLRPILFREDRQRK
ncbi:MAG: SGNH/GDSL hydrolase family protein [Planctomycetaceae bacterium]